VTHNERRFQFRLRQLLVLNCSGFVGKSRLNRWWSPSELETEIRSGTWAKRFYLWRLRLLSCRAPLSAGRNCPAGTVQGYGSGLVSKPGDGNVTDRESNPRPLGCMSGDSTTHLKRSAVMSGTGIHRLIYRDMCVERGASYAACCSQQLGLRVEG